MDRAEEIQETGKPEVPEEVADEDNFEHTVVLKFTAKREMGASEIGRMLRRVMAPPVLRETVVIELSQAM